MDKQQNHIELNDDVLNIIIKKGVESSDFIEWYKTMSKINKQFYRIVLNIILILTQINFYNTTFITYQKTNGLEKILEKTKNITTLELKTITCNSNVLEALVVFLKNNTPLTTCRFNNIYKYELKKTIKNVSAITYDFLEAFLTNTTYIELDFSNMSIDSSNAVDLIANYLTKPNIKLTTLDLSSNKLVRYTRKITKAFEINKTLTKLNLSNTIIWVSDIAKALKYNNTLLTLDLSYTSIGNITCISFDGGEAIAEAIKINRTLKTLLLNNNGIHSGGIAAIAIALVINQTLTTIDISDNIVGYKAATAIALAIKINTTLSTLILKNTKMRSCDAITIAKAWEKNSTLTLIDISNNDVRYDGAIAIAEAVKINTTLTTLILRCCNISVDGEKAIREALETNTTIQIITT
jgi:Ran GTPase-activating protein (RanGAP) involved in mRNA processing and transport